MDTSGFSQVGRYGTLSLLKRQGTAPTNSSAPADNVITSFGIDDEEITFGSSTTCGVRLYYPDVESLHCRIVFEDKKAFLAILGASGVLVDGCKVYPHTSGGNDSAAQQTLIPLTNNSEFEIHNKRFRFTYPPKEIRKALYATPARPPQRSLRLSMIHSAQVFSPRPSKDPRENLRILQSPLKNPVKSPVKARNPSPLKSATGPGFGQQEDNDSDEEEEEIILVHTNHPRVVEEEKDLVILEDVPISLLSPSKTGYLQLPIAQPKAPRTPPRRKSIGGTALHRAVLIRSAQRAVMKAEKEREEEEEEMEVLGAVVGADDQDDEDNFGEYDNEDVEMEDVDEDEDEESTDEEDEEERRNKEAQKPLWRKSLERIIPWPFGATPDAGGEEEDMHDQQPNGDGYNHDHDRDDDNIEDNENENPTPLVVLSTPQTPVKRALGSFMTPQTQAEGPRRGIFANVGATTLASDTGAVSGNGQPVAGRFSLGGGEARRVIVQQPWKIRDLIVPPPAPSTTPLMAMDPPTASSRFDNASPVRPPATPAKHELGGAGSTGTPARGRAAGPTAVSEEERKAIQERRRSAVKEVGNFWVGGAPGMSPAKSNGMSSGASSSADSSRRNSTSPVKPSASRSGTLPARQVFGSPTKGRPLAHAIAEDDEGMSQHVAADEDKDEEEELDTRGLLERMKETVDNMTRRRSVVLGGGGGSVLSTPQQPTATLSRMSIDSAPTTSMEGVIKKLDFTTIRTPGKPPSKGTLTPATPARLSTPQPVTDDLTQREEDQDKALDHEEPFSLLRPGALEERRQSMFVAQPAQEEQEVETVVVVPLPIVVVDAADDDREEEPAKETARKTTRGRARLLRPAPAAKHEAEGGSDVEMEDEDEQTQKATTSKPASKLATKTATRRPKSKTPQPSTEEDSSVPTKPSAVPKRTRKGTAEPEAVTPAPAKPSRKATAAREEEESEEEEAKVPAKRGRKPPAVIEEPEREVQQEVEPTPAPVKRGRPRKIVTPTTAEESSTQEESAAPPKTRAKPASKTTTATTKKPNSKVPVGVKGKAAAVRADDEEEDDDPLDSYNVGSSSRKDAEDGEEIDSPAPPPRTAATTKAKPKVAATKKKAVVKQEEEDRNPTLDESAPLATTRVGRGGKTNASRTVAAAKTPAVKITIAGKTRGRPKTPATAPAATTSTIAAGAEKENAPGSGSGGEKDKLSSPDVADEAPVKVRVSRSTRGATGVRKTAKVKVEEAEEGQSGMAPARTRATRVMRTRTKTG